MFWLTGNLIVSITAECKKWFPYPSAMHSVSNRSCSHLHVLSLTGISGSGGAIWKRVKVKKTEDFLLTR